MKNPYMSLFLSGANRVANTARAHVTAAAKRETAKQGRQLTQVWLDAFMPPLSAPRKKRKAPK